MKKRSSEIAAGRCASLLFASILATASTALSAAPPAQAPRPGERELARALQDEGLSGIVWSTIAADGAVQIGATGSKNGPGGRMDPDTRVHVGSVAKAVLAAGILRLVSEGALSLDAPVSEVVPSIRFDNPWQATEPVRVRHLLAHTAGLENLRLWQFFSLQATPDISLAEVFERDNSVLRIQARPGSRFRYSNIGYTLLGMVIEAVTGDRYEHYLDAHLLQPLAMTDSTFEYTTQVGAGADRRLAMGHFEDGVTQHAVPLYLRPAAQFTTTAADMATFGSFLMGDGTVDGQTFIDPSLLAALSVPSRTEAAFAGLGVGHGLMLAGRDRHGVLGECHPGNTVGFMAMLCLFPSSGQAFFWAINTDSETADYDRFNAMLVESLGTSPSAPAAKGVPAGDIPEWQGFYVPSPFPIRPFAWIDTVPGVTRVHWDGASLRIQSLGSETLKLESAGGRLFQAPGRTMASHVLLTSADGDRVISTGVRSHVRVRTSTIALLWFSLLAGLLGLAYVLACGAARALRGRLKPSSPLFPPLVSIVALLLPVPLFLSQSVLALGDRTMASIVLAITTGALPLAVITGLVLRLRQWKGNRTALLDAVALVAALQCMLVLAAWGMLPLRLWR